jgi:hypothetical protein
VNCIEFWINIVPSPWITKKDIWTLKIYTIFYVRLLYAKSEEYSMLCLVYAKESPISRHKLLLKKSLKHMQVGFVLAAGRSLDRLELGSWGTEPRTGCVSSDTSSTAGSQSRKSEQADAGKTVRGGVSWVVDCSTKCYLILRPVSIHVSWECHAH